jgi:predicted nucleic acid-binding protein
MRTPAVAERLRPLMDAGSVATCAVVDLEVLYSARSRDYDATLFERRSLLAVPITPRVMERSIEIQRLLARRGEHRLPITDLIVAAAAESADLTILHYDGDYERIAAVTAQPHEWVVPRGTI